MLWDVDVCPSSVECPMQRGAKGNQKHLVGQKLEMRDVLDMKRLMDIIKAWQTGFSPNETLGSSCLVQPT